MHRAALLVVLLPAASAYGFNGTHAETEPLLNSKGFTFTPNSSDPQDRACCHCGATLSWPVAQKSCCNKSTNLSLNEAGFGTARRRRRSNSFKSLTPPSHGDDFENQQDLEDQSLGRRRRSISGLDINSANVFFEGPERSLYAEISVEHSPTFSTDEIEEADGLNLRELLTVSEWAKLLDHAKVEILAVSQSHGVNAYVLSESSLFVWKQGFLLKTCGTTTPLKVLGPVLQKIGFKLAEKTRSNLNVSSKVSLDKVVFRRPKLQRPEEQEYPHVKLEDEVEYIRGFGGASEGASFRVIHLGPGTEHGAACIVAEKAQGSALLAPKQRVIEGASTSITTDISGTGISPQKAAIFFTDGTVEGQARRAACKQSMKKLWDRFLRFCRDHVQRGVHPSAGSSDTNCIANSIDMAHVPEQNHSFSACRQQAPHGDDPDEDTNAKLDQLELHPEHHLDEFFFSPMGYSANLIWREFYITVHVTPQHGSSYASLETNVVTGSGGENGIVLQEFLELFVELFEPRETSVVEIASSRNSSAEADGASGVRVRAKHRIPLDELLQSLSKEVDLLGEEHEEPTEFWGDAATGDGLLDSPAAQWF